MKIWNFYFQEKLFCIKDRSKKKRSKYYLRWERQTLKNSRPLPFRPAPFLAKLKFLLLSIRFFFALIPCSQGAPQAAHFCKKWIIRTDNKISFQKALFPKNRNPDFFKVCLRFGHSYRLKRGLLLITNKQKYVQKLC